MPVLLVRSNFRKLYFGGINMEWTRPDSRSLAPSRNGTCIEKIVHIGTKELDETPARRNASVREVLAIRKRVTATSGMQGSMDSSEIKTRDNDNTLCELNKMLFTIFCVIPLSVGCQPFPSLRCLSIAIVCGERNTKTNVQRSGETCENALRFVTAAERQPVCAVFALDRVANYGGGCVCVRAALRSHTDAARPSTACVPSDERTARRTLSGKFVADASSYHTISERCKR